jgi:23S rRNA pseudouridine2605 synthase
VRLAKYIARCGVASRRHAEQLVTSGRVTVDGERVVDPARDVDERADVRVEGRPLAPQALEHWIVNKPAGVVSTAHDPQGRPKVTELVTSGARLFPVGRLDADSEGLLLLTNDGELGNRLMHPSFEIEKEYRARVVGRVSDRALGRLREGLELEDGPTAPARARVVERDQSTTVIEIVIHEGRKRQVRRMCKAVGHPVLSLERTRLGPLGLDDLPRGEARRLGEDEIATLRELAHGRSGPRPAQL